jgi:hypothetical protein
MSDNSARHVCGLCRMNPENCPGRTLYAGREDRCHYLSTNPQAIARMLLEMARAIEGIRCSLSPLAIEPKPVAPLDMGKIPTDCYPTSFGDTK